MKYNEAMFGTDIQNPDGKHSIRNVGLNLHAPLIIRNYNIDEQETAEKKEKYTPQKLLSDSLQLDSNTRVVLEYNIQQFRKFSTEHAIDYVKILEELKSDSLLSALDLGRIYRYTAAEKERLKKAASGYLQHLGTIFDRRHSYLVDPTLGRKEACADWLMEYAENNLPEEERYHRSGEQHDYFSSNLKKLHQKHLDLNSIKQASYAMNQTQNTHLNTCNKECDHESDNCYESFFETIEASIVGYEGYTETVEELHETIRDDWYKKTSGGLAKEKLSVLYPQRIKIQGDRDSIKHKSNNSEEKRNILKEQSELYKQIGSILEIAGMNIDPQ